MTQIADWTLTNTAAAIAARNVSALEVTEAALTPYGQNIGTAEEPVLHRAIELAGAQSWGHG
jgi:hypothetical protein